MSQSGADPEPPGRPGRYQRSTGGLFGALLVTVVAVSAFVGLRAVFDQEPPSVARSVDWRVQVEAGSADGRLQVLAPRELPRDWVATSAEYDAVPSWRLGLLTDEEQFVGVYERVGSVEDLVEERVDESAERGEEVEVGGETWQEWSDAEGDYALSRELREPLGENGALVVVGSAPPTVVRDLAARLVPAGALAP